jgi:DNA-directed RNA polymerase subunit omega
MENYLEQVDEEARRRFAPGFLIQEKDNMARITVEDCLEKVGDGNRFSLIHLAVERIRQHRKGEPFLVAGKNKEVVMTLREIAAGKVTFENIHDLPKKRKAEEKVAVATEADDNAE